MIEREEAKKLTEQLLSKVKADEAEVILTSDLVGSTRFSRNAISQNAVDTSLRVRLRVVKDGRQGIATSNSYDDAAFTTMIERATAAAEHARPDPDLLPMLDKQPEYSSVDSFNMDTYDASPRDRAERILEQCNLARQRDLEAAGLFKTGGGCCVYANSRDVFAYNQSSLASFSFSAFADDGSVEGACDGVAHNIHSLSTRKIGNTAIDRALRGRKPKVIDPGRYDVVLERGAVSDLVLFLSWLGFNSLRHVEGRSGLSGKVGEKVFSEKFSLRADPCDPRYEGRPFDFEGFARNPVQMIEDGVVKELPTDRRTAKALGMENSGYGNQQPDADGPRPDNVAMKEGDSSVEDMIRSTERGLYVAQFHYSNTVDPMAMSITGMTRAGLWMIENGEIAYPVKNLRYTENLVEAFSRIEAIGKIAEPTGGGLFGGGFILCPMKIKDFNFSSSTEF